MLYIYIYIVYFSNPLQVIAYLNWCKFSASLGESQTLIAFCMTRCGYFKCSDILGVLPASAGWMMSSCRWLTWKSLVLLSKIWIIYPHKKAWIYTRSIYCHVFVMYYDENSKQYKFEIFRVFFLKSKSICPTALSSLWPPLPSPPLVDVIIAYFTIYINPISLHIHIFTS